MKHSLFWVGVAGLMLTVSVVQPSLASPTIYKWQSEDGATQMSDTLPPEAQEQGYRVVDPMTGQVVREVPPAAAKDSDDSSSVED